MHYLLLSICSLLLFSVVITQKTCIKKVYGPNAITCICNSTYCDSSPSIGSLQTGQAAIFTTTASGKRFERTVGNFTSGSNPNTIQITPDDTQKRQTIQGFGGAFTDATGYNLQKLSAATQQNFINTYYGSDGIGYIFGRVPIASCDFSLSNYSYDDVTDDFNLTNFALRPEDFNYKIPFIKIANTATKNQLKLYASPWSAPGWMKTNNQMEHGGNLKGPVNGHYWQTWANYFIRFFEEYQKNGIIFWGATMQNEPGANQVFQSMLYNSSMERDYAKGVWGKTLRNNPLTKDLKLMVLDHNRDMVLDFAQTIFGDPEAYNILDGLAVHWYMDDEYGRYGWVKPDVLSQAHEVLKGKWMLYTEACNEGHPDMGGWTNADKYVTDIINDLNNWVTGWVDWNLAVDAEGGPNWVHNFVDAPIVVVSNTSDEFEKQPMFYGLGHISKFIPPDSTVISYNLVNPKKANLAVLTAVAPDNGKVVVINNRDLLQTFQVSILNKNGATLNLGLEPQSFTTVVYYECLSKGSACTSGSQCCSGAFCFNNVCT